MALIWNGSPQRLLSGFLLLHPKELSSLTTPLEPLFHLKKCYEKELVITSAGSRAFQVYRNSKIQNHKVKTCLWIRRTRMPVQLTRPEQRAYRQLNQIDREQISEAELKSMNFRARIFYTKAEVKYSESALGSWEYLAPSFLLCSSTPGVIELT